MIAGILKRICSVGKLIQLSMLLMLTLVGLMPHAQAAEDTVCARVKIEIKQELTLERQAFDAEMVLSNALDTDALTDVKVVVNVTDELGAPILVTNDPNNTSAKFFVRLSNIENIANVDGTGTVAPSSTATINWLLIPAPGSAGISTLGKKYLVGATLTYKFGAESHTLEVSPDVITVKPLPLLTLDYFLTKDVWADNPLTDTIEPVEPFTLGVRVKNDGFATAQNLKIDSAQPKIVENNQGLLINFNLIDSYVDDAPVQNTLLIDFGDIEGNRSKMGRWNMETTLAGTFTEFTAKFSHADELGGAVTSILQATNAHLLLRDVRVDLPGRDTVRDFLAIDGEVLRVYESDSTDTVVTDRSNVAQLTATASSNGNANYALSFPATAGFAYVKLPDPFGGTKALGTVVRSDAKVMLPENVWLSKTRNRETDTVDYWVNFFDVNTTGVYNTEFQAPPVASQPPVIQFIPDRTVKEEDQVSFLVEASSQSGKPITLSAAPLPAGATFVMQAPEAGVQRATFSWTPQAGSVGEYLIVYTATDGELSATRSATISVESNAPPPGPETPTIVSPVSNAEVTSLTPEFSVLTSANPLDPTQQVEFEIYSDEAMSVLIETAVVDKAPAGAGNGAGGTVAPTTWTPENDLNDNTHYYWRARAFDGGEMYSLWVDGQFKVNLFNDAPDEFNLTTPTPGANVDTLLPTLAWTNASDKDGDEITYSVRVYTDIAQTALVEEAVNLPPGADGMTSWAMTVELTNHDTYYWKVVAKDALGAKTESIARPFTVFTGNTAPSAPVITSPTVGGEVQALNTVLVITNSTDVENDPIVYKFEYDTVNTFDSGNKHASGPIVQDSSGNTSWAISGLVENVRYYWRVKANDGYTDSAWVIGDFLANAVNEAPATPTVQNPGNGAWTSNTAPVLGVNAVQDPEGGAVRYEFEVYTDAGLTQQVASDISNTTTWTVSPSLQDKKTHWWRARALDSAGLASDWTTAAILYVSSGSYQNPTIQVVAPTVPTMPTVVTTADGEKKQVTIKWVANDPNIDPTIALYYSNEGTGYTGDLIVDGIRQPAGSHSGSYVWDVTALPVGNYYIYGVVYDPKGIGRAYAAGSVVIPPAEQAGGIHVKTGNKLKTNEKGRTENIKIKLTSAPTSNVIVPVTSTNENEGIASPNPLVFTKDNWSEYQIVSVEGQPDCADDGDVRYQVIIGNAISTDPNYIGLSREPVEFTNLNDKRVKNGTTNHPDVQICRPEMVSRTKIAKTQTTPKQWEYVLKVKVVNVGTASFNGLTATLQGLSFEADFLDSDITIGAIAPEESINSVDTVIIRSKKKLGAKAFKKVQADWSIQIQ